MIKPYFEEEDFALYHGDILEILNQFEDRKFDLIFFNPCIF